ncbi:MAG TPA: GNAT family N-acetyltransferase [Woeseiaceae bacterium]|nr:GNAT family N-acetyltransferase [Woeseiaceae bacterium]
MTTVAPQPGAGYVVKRADRRHLRDVPAIEQAAVTLFSVEDVPLALRFRVTAPEPLAEAQRDGRLWVAENAAGKTVGFALAEIVDGEAYLTEVDVHPAHARQGIGTRLVQTVAGWAAGQGFAFLLLVTFRHLPWNAPFYRKLGFEAVPPGDMGPELRGIFDEEAQAGIDPGKRVAMRLALPGRGRAGGEPA